VSYSRAVAQISFKLGVSKSARPVGGLLDPLLTPGVIAGLVTYGLAMLLWLTALRRVEVSQAYPFVGLSFVLTAVLGHAVFGDTVGVQRIAGIVLVIVGIVLVARS
jgi:drug/metabolite transporter (DMT)-like permease